MGLPKPIVVALDAMGGDFAPAVVVQGALLALKKHPLLKCLFYGDEKKIAPLLSPDSLDPNRFHIYHTTQVVSNDTRPAAAVRLKESSMRLAIQAVASGKAHAVVSAGNTGAYMALSKILLKTFPGIDRPAIPAIIPTLKGCSVVLDLGANIDCTANHLVQFSVLGEAFARHLLKRPSPTIGLLNVGSEEIKGLPHLQEAAQRLREIEGLRFQGFVEGDDITQGTVDVVVTDGFSGNIALKSIEGTARLVMQVFKENLLSSWRGKLGSWIARPAFYRIKQRLDPRLYNGAVFLGLKSVAVKSHGGTDEVGFANALDVAINMVEKKVIQDIESQTFFLTQRNQESEPKVCLVAQ